MKLVVQAFVTAFALAVLFAFAVGLLTFVAWVYDAATTRRGDRLERERYIYELGRQDEAASRD
jgi:hypothetical protein